MRTAEQNEVLGTFLDLLSAATGDGGVKRAAGLKPSWKVDGSHLAAAYRHLDPSRERYDEDSGTHKLVHAAWRLLAVAWQDMRDDGKLPAEPDDEVRDFITEFLKAEDDNQPLVEAPSAISPTFRKMTGILNSQFERIPTAGIVDPEAQAARNFEPAPAEQIQSIPRPSFSNAIGFGDWFDWGMRHAAGDWDPRHGADGT